MGDALNEALPGLLVTLYGLMEIRYWLHLYRCKAEMERLRRRIADMGENRCSAP